MLLPHPTVHDVFTLLCDVSLQRRPQRSHRLQPHPYRWRYLHRVSRLAALLAGDTPRPTPLAGAWLARSTAAQIAELADAWAGDCDSGPRRRALNYLNDFESGAPVDLHMLTGRRSHRGQRLIWQPLLWLGLLRQDGARLLANSPADAPDPPPPWRIHGRWVEVKPPYCWQDLWLLEHIAHLQHIGPPRRYLLHSAWAQRNGVAPPVCLALLEAASHQPLAPQTAELFRPRPHVIARSGLLLTFTDPGELQRLQQRPPWQSLALRFFTPNDLWAPASQAPPMLRALSRRGLHVTQSANIHSPPRAHPPFLRLVQSAHVLQALFAQLDLPAPWTPAELEELYAALPPAQQRRLQRAAGAQIDLLSRRLPEARALAPAGGQERDHGRETAAGQDSDRIDAVISAALAAGSALQIHYRPPWPRPLITRPILPQSLQSWGAHTYLLALCLRHNEPRTFRLDRIVAVRALYGSSPLIESAKSSGDAADHHAQRRPTGRKRRSGVE